MAAFLGRSSEPPPPVLRTSPDRLAASWEKLRSRRIYFAHQSVGGNLIHGLGALLSEQPSAGLRIVESQDAQRVQAGTFLHAPVGRNEQPRSKYEDFERQLGAGIGAVADIAFMKLCYIDFTPTTDVEALFALHRETVRRIEEAYPGLRVVHVTTPLMVEESGPKAWLKGALRRPLYSVEANRQRHAFNERLRATYGAAGTVFDLAAYEAGDEPLASSHRPVPALHPALTDDGGHLRPEAARAMAIRLAEFLATVPARGAAK